VLVYQSMYVIFLSYIISIPVQLNLMYKIKATETSEYREKTVILY